MIYLGCAGWSYQHWRGTFYPKGTRNELEYYTQYSQFNEINTSYYRIPKDTQSRLWYWQTPKDFIFSAKLVKDITHPYSPRFQKVENIIEKFFLNMEQLEEKLQIIIAQFPKFFHYSESNFDFFRQVLGKCRSLFTNKIAVEFRNTSWIRDTVLKYLQNKSIQLVDTPHLKIQSDAFIDDSFYYIRLLGDRSLIPDEMLGKKFLDKSIELQQWSKKISELNAHYETIFVVINNRFSGYAINDAIILYNRFKKENLAVKGFQDRTKYLKPKPFQIQMSLNDFF
ncbi:DUF72 domain-containing protein [Candidatus Hodarchaeum mangrovi]